MDCFCLSEPPSITEGVFVWHKFRNYPFWPALVSATTFVKLVDATMHNLDLYLDLENQQFLTFDKLELVFAQSVT